MLEIALC